MTHSPPPPDDWDPLTLQAVENVFAGAPFRWWICGGHALELHAGRSWRSQEDLDIGILRTEAEKVYSWLADWDLWVAARGELRAWQGEALAPHRGENNIWARESSESPWRFDLNIGSGDETEWAYRRDQKTRRAWDTAVLKTPDDLPYLAPEVQLLFKSKKPASQRRSRRQASDAAAQRRPERISGRPPRRRPSLEDLLILTDTSMNDPWRTADKNT